MAAINLLEALLAPLLTKPDPWLLGGPPSDLAEPSELPPFRQVSVTPAGTRPVVDGTLDQARTRMRGAIASYLDEWAPPHVLLW